jgi:molybdopterin/thiamine biosynthesis adenylyltransferase
MAKRFNKSCSLKVPFCINSKNNILFELYNTDLLIDNPINKKIINQEILNKHCEGDYDENILTTCIDRIDVRLSLSHFTYIGKNHLSVFSKPIYWIDVGNNKMNGQIYLDDYGEKFQRYHDIFGKQIVNIDEDNKSDGCNIINSLNEQELFINEFMANLTVDFIYRILKNRIINHNLIFADLLNYNIQIDKKLKL